MKKNFLALSFALGAALILATFSSARAQNQCADLWLGIGKNVVVTSLHHQHGPILKYQADPVLRGPGKNSYRIGTYNMLNLYDHVAPQVNGSQRQYSLIKDDSRRRGNAQAIELMDSDIQVLVEVENLAALKRFTSSYLKDQYQPFLIDGNDGRGIDVAVLVKRNLPIEFEWRSYKKVNNSQGRPVFSRDLPVGLVYERDSTGQRSEKPRFAILATHYKSQRAQRGEEHLTALKREEQARATVQIVDQIRREFGEDLPVFLAGDFNNQVHSSPEFRSLYEYGFKDTLDMLPAEKIPTDRATHYYFPRSGPPHANQIDAILALGTNIRVVDGEIVSDRDQAGNILPAPTSYAERETRPSDHRPIVVEVELP